MDMFSILDLEEDPGGQNASPVPKRAAEVEAASGSEEFSDKAEALDKKKAKKKKAKKKKKKKKKKEKKRKRSHESESVEGRTQKEKRKRSQKENEKKAKASKGVQGEEDACSDLAVDANEGQAMKKRKSLKPGPPTPLMDSSSTNLQNFIVRSKVVLEEARASNAGVFLDLCCGAGGVGKRAESVHGYRSISVDWKARESWIIQCDLADPAIRSWIKTEIIDDKNSSKNGVACMLHIPCETFSSARHGKPGGRAPVPLRDYGKNVWGLPDLSPRDQAKLEEGNRIARALLAIRDDLKKAGHAVALENGDTSMLFKVPEMHAEDAQMLKVCYCMMGRSFRKRTRLLVWNAPSPGVFKEEAHRCATEFSCNSTKGVCRRTGKPHMLLRGWSRGKALTLEGEKYPKKFVNIIARVLCSEKEPAGE